MRRSGPLENMVKKAIKEEVQKLQEEFEERQEEKRQQKQEQLDEVLKSFDFERFNELQEEEEEEEVFNYQEVFNEVFEQKTLWDKINIIRKRVDQDNMWDVGMYFNVETGEGTASSGTYVLHPLKHTYGEVLQVLEDIHKCLEKHDSENIDFMYLDNPKGLMVILSTNGIIDNTLFYKTYQTEGRDRRGFREEYKHFDSHYFSQPLKIALEFDCVIHKKDIIEWEINITDSEEYTQLLKQMIDEDKNFNYSQQDARTRAEVQADNEKIRQEQAKIRQEQAQIQAQQQMMTQLQQDLQEFEQKKQMYDMLLQMQQQQQLFQQQMAQMMAQYKQQQQQEEYDDDDEEYDEEDFEDDEDFEE